MAYKGQKFQKYTEDQREEVRHGYPGVSNRKLSEQLRIPIDTIKSWRLGRRGIRGERGGRKKGQPDYKGTSGKELNIYFIRRATWLLSMFETARKKLAEEGEFDPVTLERELDGDAEARQEPTEERAPVFGGPSPGPVSAGGGLAVAVGKPSIKPPLEPSGERELPKGRMLFSKL